MFYARATTPLSAAGRAACERLFAVAGDLVTAGKPTLFDAYSIADSDLAFMLQRLILNGEDVPAKLVAFANAVWARPVVREFVTRERPAYVPY